MLREASKSESEEFGSQRGERPAFESAKEKGRQAYEQVRSSASSIAQKAWQVTERTMQQGKDQLAGRLTDLAASIRSMGGQLHEKKQDSVAHYADRAADQVDRCAQYLRDHDPQQIREDVEEELRRRPALYMSLAFLGGLALSRFIKSSSGRAERQRPRSSSESASAASWSPEAPSERYSSGEYGEEYGASPPPESEGEFRRESDQ